MQPSSPVPRSVVLPLSTEITPNAVPGPGISLASLLEDLKMLANKLDILESSHRIFGTGEDMVFRPIKNVVRMTEFMENSLTWIRLELFKYETAASAPHSDPEIVEACLNKLRMVMDEFFRQMHESEDVVQREFHRIIELGKVELEQPEYQDLHHLLPGQMNLDDLQ
ncbi:hypothetical protein BGZ97_001201 [Linnemannia gamsii]|uniref:Uncharacterized protein n=1 Tax=Linnemannia gamsii TaxID=64522 RepID=A0A9P6RL08_9FUNG|nr:hypothetical protein BGZ97_001201 [Linnemannia gamsii]